MNGLVYFDQFGALTTLNLWLVILGIVVLLGGVWAVSVLSGGAEPVTWREEDDEEAVMSEESALSPAMSPELPDVSGHSRNVSLPNTPMPDPLSPGAMSDSLNLSPSRGRRVRRRYSSLLGSEGTSGAALGGLSIGLSPVSPGFVLRPRRRTGNQSLSSVADGMGMRRSVSEADVSREGASRRAKARWKWLRNVWDRAREE